MSLTDKQRMKQRQKAQRYRQRLRQAGLRPVQFWVYDTRNPAFIRQVHEASLRLRDDPHEAEMMDFIDALQADNVFDEPDAQDTP